MREKNQAAEILLYDVIDPYFGLSAKAFREQLVALGQVDTVHVRINSPGGAVFDGLAIYNTLRSHAARVIMHIDGMALSMASVVAMAGDEIEMADNAFLMIHNPMNLVLGDAEEMRDVADLLDKVKTQLVNTYAARTKRPAAEIAALMDAETWFNAEEAIESGFADRRSEQLALAAKFDPSRFTNVPRQLLSIANVGGKMSTEPTPKNTAAQEPRPAQYGELKAALAGADAAFLCTQLEANATLAQAQTAWMAEQARRLDAARAQAKTAQAEAKAAKEAAELAAKKVGVETLGGGKRAGSGADGDPIAQWNDALAKREAAGMTRAKAIARLVRDEPELHAAYLEAYNAIRRAAK